MKVNLDITVQVSDDQRVKLANVIDDKITKRQATRDEIKSFIWSCGDGWEGVLLERYTERFAGSPEAKAAGISPETPVTPVEIDPDDML